MLTAVIKFSPMELCDQGEYRLAAEMAGLTVGEWPENDSGGILTPAERLLLAGIIQSSLSGIQQEGDQAFARLVLEKSVELFGADRRSLMARDWLAWVEYRAGNADKALTDTEVLLSEPLETETRFRILLLRTTIYWERKQISEAWGVLLSTLPIYEACSSLSKGKFHGHRGLLLRAKGDLDRAILDYTAAIYFFGESNNVRAHAIAINNLAGVYCDAKKYTEAYQYAEQARALFHDLGDKTYEAEALDQIAQIHLAQQKLAKSAKTVGQGFVLDGLSGMGDKIKPNDEDLYGDTHSNDGRMPDISPLSLRIEPRDFPMSPLAILHYLIYSNPSHAPLLLSLIIWISSTSGNPQLEAERDNLERVCFSYTEEGEREREQDRERRLESLSTTSGS